MNKEYETKVIHINKEEIIKKLKDLGAKKTKDALMRRWVFDWVDKDPEKVNEWIRLRDEGDKTTITYKNKTEDADTKEIEVEVNNFNDAALLLQQIPFKRKFYQENKRIVYELNEIEFMIDTWPGLKPHLEVEGKSKEKMIEGLTLLNLNGKEKGDISVNSLYEEIGVHLHSIESLKFEDFKK